MPQPQGLCIDISGVLHVEGETVAGVFDDIAAVVSHWF